MPIPYPMQTFGRFKLGLALTYQLVHDRFGFDFGERYHRDVEHRIQTTMAIDRAVFEAYGSIGLGYETPFPRASIEPFGHRFMPAMYGAETGYAADADPWGKPRAVTAEEILRSRALDRRTAGAAASRCGASWTRSTRSNAATSRFACPPRSSIRIIAR